MERNGKIVFSLLMVTLLASCGGGKSVSSSSSSLESSSEEPISSSVSSSFEGQSSSATTSESSLEEESSSEEPISSSSEEKSEDSSEISSFESSSEESSEESSSSEYSYEDSSEESSSVEESSSLSSSEQSSQHGSYIEEHGYTPGTYTTRYYTDTSLIKQIDADLDEDGKNVNTTFSYSNLPSIFPYTDVDPEDPNKILSFYSGVSTTYAGNCNREHVWPNSRKGEATEKDPHVVRPTLISENSSRGNDYYGETTGWDPACFNNPKYRGISARIIFYCAVKYQDSGLYLDDEDNPTSTNKNQRPTMGKLSKLLEWNLQYPVDETEITRNSVLVEKYKWNCNPFILDPSLATTIWGHYNAECEKACGLI